MSTYCHVVPWYNSDEWKKVYKDISDSAGNKANALNTLLIWKARCPLLPSGIESTLSLLQVHVEDTKQIEDVADDQVLRLAYSSAIMRFINHMLDTETMKGSSLYQAAKNVGVPDWIVDLRHDTAHSNNLPPIELLREACSISLQWLLKNYWEKYEPNIQDYISGQKDLYNRDENKIGTLIDLCTALSICAHPNCKIKNLSDIPNLDMRESIVNDVKYLFGDYVDLSKMKTISIMSLINIVNTQNKNLLKIPDVFTHVNKAILGEDSVFLSRDLLFSLSANEFKRGIRLSNNFLQCFEVLLTFLHSNDLLLEFVMALIKITQDSENNNFRAQLAALWVSEILLALKRSQEFALKFEKIAAENKQSKKKKDLKQLYHHWFPSVKGNNLILDLQKPVPIQLLDITYIQPIVAAFNPYLIYFIKNLLNLIEPAIPSLVAERVYKLAELISAPEKFACSASTIYTVDDLKTTGDDNDIIDITEDVQPEEMDTTIHVQEPQATGIWKIAPNDNNWSSCPIGLLPWQENNTVAVEKNHD